MEYDRNGPRLAVRLRRDFNLLTVRKIAALAADAEEVYIDLSHARLIDSEALMLLCRLIRAGKKVRLTQPPAILGEAIHILGLEPILDLDALAE